MYRVLIVIIIFNLFPFGCSRCSNEAIKSEDWAAEVALNNDISVQEVSDVVQNITDVQEGSQVMYPNIRFVQTPDGKVVPEQALKLKLPRMLNPQLLKNATGGEKEGSKGGEPQKGKE
ncbi:MAG: hypothetical protein ACP5QK_09260 [Myxococcota bacterium]